MKRTLLTLTLMFFIVSLDAQTPDLELETFATGLSRPVSIKNAGGIDTNLYVVEQDGFIKVVDASGTVNDQLFLDIDDNVIDTGNERGLLGLAFHPNYSTNGYFYVNYNNNSGNTVISRFTRSTANPLVANENSELVLLTYNQPFSNHNGGDLAFGPDGYLYISSGDGGSGGDPGNRAQTLSNLLGKMLRIDVDNPQADKNYGIPSDNPFIDNSSAMDEIWAYGLRNPWKFSFDRATNDLWIGDVGQNAREEINLTLASDTGGLNYGWRCYEGNLEYLNGNLCPDEATLTFPVSDYSHSNGRCSITGGYVYRGSTYPNFDGLYFFADVCSQEIGYLSFDGGNWSKTFENFSGSFVAFGEDINGELYVSSLGGTISRLVDANVLNVEDEQVNSVSVHPNPAKNELTIDFGTTTFSIETTISIFDIQGKRIKTVEKDNNSIQHLNISDVSKGIYILKINSESGRNIIHKLIIN